MLSASAPRANRQIVNLSRLVSTGLQLLLFCGLLLQLSADGSEHPAKTHQEIASPVKFLHWKIPAEAPVSAFVHVNVIPMDHEQTWRNQTVVVRAGHIAAFGKTGDVPLPADAVLIDGTDKYLIPGLVDMRVRVCSPGELLLYLANGVTMVRNVDGRPQHLHWRNEVNEGKELGPIMFTAGPTISAAATAAEAKRIVLEQNRAGYDGIEPGDSLSAEAFHAITAVARVLGASVFGGVNTSTGLKTTVTSPQFLSLEKIGQFAEAVLKDNPETPNADIAGAAADIRSAKVWFDPALVASGNAVQSESAPLRSQTGFEFLPHWAQKEWNASHNSPGEKPATWTFHKRIVSIMHKERVPIILGTDSMTVGTIPGFSLQQELANLVEIGFTPFEALQAATKNASEWFVHPEGGGVFGTVTLRERADLVLLDADPLVDIRNVSKIRGVMVQGRWLPEVELQRMLGALPAAYEEEEKFLNAAVQSQPGAASKYLQENDPYHKLTNEVMANLVLTKGMSALEQVYARLRQDDPTSIVIEETTVNDLGYMLLDMNRASDAVEVFEVNMRAHPASARAHDSLARAYLASGNKMEAVRSFKQALSLDPNFQTARRSLDQIEDKEAPR